MLASTTIKKDTVSRKKAKEARELENIKRLVESENDNNHEERATSEYNICSGNCITCCNVING